MFFCGIILYINCGGVFMYKFGFIGLGNMGYAIMKGLMSENSAEDFSFYDISAARAELIETELGIASSESMEDLVKNSKYIFLSVKPQIYRVVMESIKNFINSDHIIITIAPGFDIKTVKMYLGNGTRVIRSMPNTPALVGEGMSVVTFSDDQYSDSEIREIKDIFLSFGEMEIIDEKQMDAVVPISGSSPAYIYILIEAMADSGVSMGLSRDLAYKLASQSVVGAGRMVLETDSHPAELKDAVCSPGGTTIEAVTVLEAKGFRSAVIEAMKAAYIKAKKID
jgi:pyrroline-5-carboxylate reductase